MYQHGRRTRQPRNAAVFLATIIIVGIVIVTGWYVIHKDIAANRASEAADPIVTEVAVKKDDVIKFDTDLFSFDLPGDWELMEHKANDTVNAYIYSSTATSTSGRKLYVYVDKLPQVYKIVKMQPLTVDKDGFIAGELSGDCRQFATEYEGGNSEVEAKWKNIDFICDPISANQTIGTGSEGNGIATKIGKHRYFFYFEDHNIHPDSNIFRNMLKSFRAK